MNKSIRFILAGLAGTAGLGLFFVRSDREFINRTSTAEPGSVVVLESGPAYTQTFSVERDTAVSRVGLFLRPARAQVGSGHVNLTLESEGASVTKKIPAEFVDRENTTQVRFLPAVPVNRGAEVKLTLQIPEHLSGQISAETPLAYQVYEKYRPPLAWQMGSLLLLAAFLPVVPPRRWSWMHSSSLGHFLSWLNLTSSALLLGAIIFLFIPLWPFNVLGILAALALNALHRFLGQDRLTASLMYTIDILILLELFHAAV